MSGSEYDDSVTHFHWLLKDAFHKPYFLAQCIVVIWFYNKDGNASKF